jgi:speckle-type POZ protein
MNTQEDELIFSSLGVKLFDVQGQGKIDGWGRDRFLPLGRLDQDSGILVNDSITFVIEVVVYGDMENCATPLSIGSTLDQDIKRCLESRCGADVNVVVGGKKEYKLHKCVLLARSPVFRAILEHPTLEREHNTILLPDDEPAVFDYFVEFLYSDYCW